MGLPISDHSNNFFFPLFFSFFPFLRVLLFALFTKNYPTPISKQNFFTKYFSLAYCMHIILFELFGGFFLGVYLYTSFAHAHCLRDKFYLILSDESLGKNLNTSA